MRIDRRIFRRHAKRFSRTPYAVPLPKNAAKCDTRKRECGQIVSDASAPGSTQWRYAYDNRNRLYNVQQWDTSTSVKLQEVQYDYDAEDRRTAKRVYQSGTLTSTEQYGLDGQNALLTTDAGLNVVGRYLFGPGADQVLGQEVAGHGSNGFQWLISDQEGSVRRVVDASGSVSKSIVYDAFGQRISTSGPGALPRYQYTGQQFDEEDKLGYFDARYYDPSQGRFVNQDPVEDGSNWYAYAGDDPVNDSDPSGLSVLGNNAGSGSGYQVSVNSGVSTQDLISLADAYLPTTANGTIPQTSPSLNSLFSPSYGSSDRADPLTPSRSSISLDSQLVSEWVGDLDNDGDKWAHAFQSEDFAAHNAVLSQYVHGQISWQDVQNATYHSAMRGDRKAWLPQYGTTLVRNDVSPTGTPDGADVMLMVVGGEFASQSVKAALVATGVVGTATAASDYARTGNIDIQHVGLNMLGTAMGGLAGVAGRARLAADSVKPFTVSDAQIGEKLGRHAQDFGLDPGNAADRQAMSAIINDIGRNPERSVSGTFRGQGPAGARGPVEFRIKGNDVVVTKPNGEFVTILKGGINNPSVVQALKNAGG